jgi:hypothetical protein
VRASGLLRSENAGISNDKESGNLSRRKTKVSWGRLVRPGLVGPKPRPKGVGDGHPVNIPEPSQGRLYDGVTLQERLASERLCWYKPVGQGIGKSVPY